LEKRTCQKKKKGIAIGVERKRGGKKYAKRLKGG